MKIAIIGGGNLGSSIAKGLLLKQFISDEDMCVTTRKNCVSNTEAVKNSKYILVAVKPYQIKEVLEGLKDHFTQSHVLVSTVSGIELKLLKEWTGDKPELFRAMPNTAIAIGESMTCIAHGKASEKNIVFVKGLFSALGKVIMIDEQLMNAATVLAACGTAFAMRYIRANIQAGVQIGFHSKDASLIAAQTIKGACELLLQTGTHPEAEIDKVATPKGCTIAGLNEMEHEGFSSSLIKGVLTSYNSFPG